MICKNTLDKLGKAAFNSLSDDDKLKYTTASNIVELFKGISNGLSITDAVPNIGNLLLSIGETAGSTALLALACSISGRKVDNLTEATTMVVAYIGRAAAKIVNQVMHEVAAKLAVLFGINENPGIVGAVIEWVYLQLIKPVIATG